MVVESANAGAFDAALRQVVWRATTPPTDASGRLADPACETVLLLFGNPATTAAAATTTTTTTANTTGWHATSAALGAVRALGSQQHQQHQQHKQQQQHRSIPVVDFRSPAERAAAPKRFGAGALRAYDETFDLAVSKKPSADKVAAALHVIVSLPSLRNRLTV